MNRRIAVAAASVLLVFGLSRGQLGYVECSTGFQNNPEMEGGRTELEFADVNNDGNIDILSIGDHGSPGINTDEHGVMVWFGDGQGNWSVFQYGEFGYGGIAIGDVNADGKWDVGYGMHHAYSSDDLGDQLMEVALGDGTGRMWTAWDDSMLGGNQAWGQFSTDFADIDNDGDLDVGSTSFGYGLGVLVYRNLGTGTWRRCFGLPESTNSQMEFYFRDVNRDGNADIIAATGDGSVWLGDGDGGFTPSNAGLPSSSYGLSGLSVGDVDNDGGCDVAFANTNGGVEAWTFDDATSHWQSFSGSLPASGDFEGTQLCDMNADRFTDLCAQGGGHTKVWLGDGAGDWTEAADITTPAPGYYTALRTGADFDHNGYPDIALVADEGSWPSDHNVAHAFRESSAVGGLSIFPVFPRGGEKLMDGSAQFIDWWSAAPDAESTRVRLELSTTGNSGPWQLIADTLRNAGRYQWFIPPGIVSGNCYIRYAVTGPAGTADATTPRAFALGDTFVSIAEERPTPVPARAMATTTIRGILNLTSAFCNLQSDFVLLDASGRKVLDLGPGPNDISRLSSGVYFVHSTIVNCQSQMTKVIIAH